MRSDRIRAHFHSDTAIEEKTFEFGAAVVRMMQQTEHKIPKVLADKVMLLGTEIGALVSEAHEGNNRRRYLKFMNEARRNSREIAYWFKMLDAVEVLPQDVVIEFLDRAREINRLLTKSCDAIKQELKEEEQAS